MYLAKSPIHGVLTTLCSFTEAFYPPGYWVYLLQVSLYQFLNTGNTLQSLTLSMGPLNKAQKFHTVHVALHNADLARQWPGAQP